MNQSAENAIMGMLNTFPQTNQDYAVLLRTLSGLLAGITDEAIVETARRYASGDVPGQSTTFAPSGPEFVQRVRSVQEAIELRRKPRISYAPIGRLSGGYTVNDPDAVRRRHAHRRVLMEGVTFEEFKRLSAANTFPEGATHVWQIDTVFAPEEPKQKARSWAA